MIHSEPVSAIIKITAVKISAIRIPTAFGPRVEVQKIDHVDDDLRHREDGDGKRRRVLAFENARHHEPERDGGEDHRQPKADQIAVEREVKAVTFAVICAMTIVTTVGGVVRRMRVVHRSIPIR